MVTAYRADEIVIKVSNGSLAYAVLKLLHNWN